MYEYYCRTCHKRFEDVLEQNIHQRCGTGNIQEIQRRYIGVTYSNFDDCFEDEGEKTERARDLQGRPIRQQINLYMEEQKNARNETGSS